MFKKLLEDFRDELAMTHHDQIPGGPADDADPHEFDPAELMMGIAHEMEHTHDPDIAAELAMDHLEENPHYYSELADSDVEPDNEVDAGGQGDSSAVPEQEDY